LNVLGTGEEAYMTTAWSLEPDLETYVRNSLEHHHENWTQRMSQDDWLVYLFAFLGDEPVGGVSARPNKDAYKSFTTGSWIRRDFRGRGLGTRMRSLMLSFVFETLGAETAASRAYEHNLASLRISERLGYATTGPFPRHASAHDAIPADMLPLREYHFTLNKQDFVPVEHATVSITPELLDLLRFR
jgi:RimJ/RimL family protein N-acetyltransferase